MCHPDSNIPAPRKGQTVVELTAVVRLLMAFFLSLLPEESIACQPV